MKKIIIILAGLLLMSGCQAEQQVDRSQLRREAILRLYHAWRAEEAKQQFKHMKGLDPNESESQSN